MRARHIRAAHRVCFLAVDSAQRAADGKLFFGKRTPNGRDGTPNTRRGSGAAGPTTTCRRSRTRWSETDWAGKTRPGPARFDSIDRTMSSCSYRHRAWDRTRTSFCRRRPSGSLEPSTDAWPRRRSAAKPLLLEYSVKPDRSRACVSPCSSFRAANAKGEERSSHPAPLPRRRTGLGASRRLPSLTIHRFSRARRARMPKNA